LKSVAASVKERGLPQAANREATLFRIDDRKNNVSQLIGEVNMKILKIVAYMVVFFGTAIYGISIVRGIDIIKSRFGGNEIAVSEAQPLKEAVPAFESILPPASASFEPTESFEPSGAYYIGGENAPKIFEAFSIEIETHEYSYENGVHSNTPIVPKGKLYDTTEFSFSRIAIGDREIAFETEVVGGIKYEFVGHFPLATEIRCEECEYPADLTGTLTKFKDGRVLSSATVNFYVPGC
jgi:hypothetical protein